MIRCGPPSKPTQDFGLNFGFRTDLRLKPVYADTSCSSQRAAQRLALPVGVVDTLLEHLVSRALHRELGNGRPIQKRGYEPPRLSRRARYVSTATPPGVACRA